MAENFDLETALEFLPAMTGDEKITRQLIDNIEFYGSMINEVSKPLLINFILKTRLTGHAKFSLKQTYSDVESLLEDMRNNLLPKKSFILLQNQLINCKQGNRSIKSFGSEIENLFTELTFAQCEGDHSKLQILRYINENLAIDCFRRGLNNHRIGIIIAARQFNSLSQAIQTAIDEDTIFRSNRFCHYFKQPKYCSKSQPILHNSYNNFYKAAPHTKLVTDHPRTILAHQYEVSNSVCIPQDQQLSQRDLSECTDLNNYNNIVMKFDSDVSSLSNNLASGTRENTYREIDISNDMIELFKSEKELVEPCVQIENCENILFSQEPQTENIENIILQKGIVKKSRHIELILGNNIEDSVKSKKIVKSKEGFCNFVPSEKKFYLDSKFLEIDKISMKDLEVFCRNRNIKELKINKNKNSRKDIKKFIRVTRKCNVGYPRIRINNEFIDIVKVKEVKNKYRERNENKNKDYNSMSTSSATIKNKREILKHTVEWSNMNLGDDYKGNKNIVINNTKIGSEGRNNVYLGVENIRNLFIDVCEIYDKRSVGIT